MKRKPCPIAAFFRRPEIKAVLRIQMAHRHNEKGYVYWLTTELIKTLAKQAENKVKQ